MQNQPQPPLKNVPVSHQIINRIALFLSLFLFFLGILQLVTVIMSNEVLPLQPLDGWLLMSMRVIAVVFSLAMFLIHELRNRYLLLLLALVALTSAGLWLRLASLLPAEMQAAAGVLQLVMSVSGLGFIVGGLFQGEDLAGFIHETWVLSVKRALEKMGLRDDLDQ